MQEQLNEIRASEAVALFQANQAGRNAIERVVGLFLSVGAIAGTTAAATHSADAVLPLPAFLLLLFSYMFQQYTDLTVLGRARLRLEDLVNTDLAAPALIYETAVAEIRQRFPLVVGVRLLQILLGLVAFGATAAATVIAFNNDDTWIRKGFVAGTTLALASALISFAQMHIAKRVTDEQLKEEGLDDARPLWVSNQMFEEVLEERRLGEVSRQTTERLLRRALTTDS